MAVANEPVYLELPEQFFSTFTRVSRVSTRPSRPPNSAANSSRRTEPKYSASRTPRLTL